MTDIAASTPSSQNSTIAYWVTTVILSRGDQQGRLLLEESITLKLWLNHLGLELPPGRQ
ncbi:MAG TPA: hypothetical protein VE860_23190 [Chthoniobacterales bacterium]|nr:hypothetical protein [Chthoniobacterales bacterium]